MNAIIIAALSGVVMMLAGLVLRKSIMVQNLAVIIAALIFGATIYDFQTTGEGQTMFYNMIAKNEMSSWFNVLLTACSFIYLLIFKKEIASVGKNDAEYFALIFFILCGVFILSGYTNLLMLFLGIEIITIPQYILAGSDKNNTKSNEASLKYFLMGAFSTGLLLMGITLLYGATGSFDIQSEAFAGHFSAEHMNSLALAGIILMVIALGFKVSAAPMHFWTPDVYDGTPTAFTPFMATIVKVSVFYAFIKLFHSSFTQVGSMWQLTIAIMIVLTLLIGNITAVYQQSVKRMLAYSSIAQAGFMLFAVFSTNATSWKGILLYGVSYTLASLGVFAALIKLKDYTYDGFNGLAKKHPILAFTTTVSLLSLSGIPLTGGFFAKYFMLLATVEQGKFLGLVVFAVLMAAISVYYYFKVIMSMYFKDGEPEMHTEPNALELGILLLNAAVIIALGVLPQLVF